MTRLRSWNAYESELSGIIDDSVLTFSLASTMALSDNTWLCIDPDNPTLREFVFAETVVQGAPGSITVRARGEEGSANPLGSAHDGGIKVRAVPVHQWLDEIFTDIEGNASDLSDHEGAVDPHSQYLTPTEGDVAYLRLDGATVPTADIPWGANKLTGIADGTLDDDAVSKLQMEAADTVVGDAAASALSDHATDNGDPHAAAGYIKASDVDGVYLKLAGGVMSGTIDMSANKILDLATGTSAGDAANTGQVTAVADDLTTHEGVFTAHAADDDAHHVKYTDANARAAVDNGTYLKLDGGSQTVVDPVTFSSDVNIRRIRFFDGPSDQAKIENTVTGMGVILGTNTFAPDGSSVHELGANSLRWSNIWVDNINGVPVANYLNP